MANTEPNESATDSAPEQPQSTAPPIRPASRIVVEQRNLENDRSFKLIKPNIPKESNSDKPIPKDEHL